MASVTRPRVCEMSARHQVALLTSMRGCDGIARANTARPIVRFLRYAVLDIGDDLALAIANNFLSTDLTWDEISTFLKDWDQYQRTSCTICCMPARSCITNARTPGWHAGSARSTAA